MDSLHVSLHHHQTTWSCKKKNKTTIKSLHESYYNPNIKDEY